PVLLHHVIDGRPRELPDQELVEDETCREEVGSYAGLRWVTVALGRLIRRLEFVDDLPGDGTRSILARSRVVEPAQERASGTAHQDGVSREVAMNDLRLAPVRVVERGEHVPDDEDLLIVGER